VRQEQETGGSASPADSQHPSGTDHPGGTGTTEHAQRIKALFDQAAPESLVRRMGIKILEATPQRAVATMPVTGNTQPYGVLHGGASCVLAETLGSVASALHAGPDRITVGIEINATHHRGPSEGLVTAVATMLHGGSTLATYEIVITDDRDRRVCTARLTCLLRDLTGRLGPPAAGASPGSAGASRTSSGDV
jgi:1,4-dihydroxy-2-naphthoyl-CoA hydrolase